VSEALTKTYDLDEPEGATAFLRDLVATGGAFGPLAKALNTTLGYVADLEQAIAESTRLLMEDEGLEWEPDEEAVEEAAGEPEPRPETAPGGES
jgi:hypothetical protein